MSNCVSYQRPSTANLLEYAVKARGNDDLCDAIILVDDEKISVHRLVLSCFSSYFKRMIRLNTRVFEFESVDASTMKLLIDYIYYGNITITSQNVLRLLSGSVCLELNEVPQFCFDFLQLNSEPENLLNLLNSVTLYENDALKDKVRKCISLKVFELAQTKCFKALSSEELKACVCNLHGLEIDEKSIYEALCTWTHHDERIRKTEFLHFFRTINLSRMSNSYLEDILLKEELIQSNHVCQTLILTALDKHNRQSVGSQATVGPEASQLVCVGGAKTLKKVSIVHTLSSDTNSYPDLPSELAGHSTLKLNNNIYCMGGLLHQTLMGFQQYGRATNQVLKLNLKQKERKWEKVGRMLKQRCGMGTSEYCGHLVVSGGKDEKNIVLSSSEFYAPDTNEWKQGPELNQSRAYHALVYCNRCLYAIGGFNSSGSLSYVEKLEGLKGSWKMVQSMQSPRATVAAVNCNGVLYVIGGQSGEQDASALKSVEKYDSIYNRWRYVSDMNVARHAHSACVLQGKIYVVGGVTTNGETVKEIEYYDPLTNRWVIVKNVTKKLFYHSLVAV